MVVRRTKEEWAEIVEAYEKSGQTLVAFSKEYGMSSKSLGAHVNNARKRREMKNIQRSAEEWRALIEEQETSGVNRSAWCKARGISPDSMTTAQRRLKAESDPSRVRKWIEVSGGEKREESPAQKDEGAISGIKIRVGGLEIGVDCDYPIDKLMILIERLVR